jgi:hypothetical protein
MNNRQNGRRRGRGGERVPNAPNRGPNPNQRPDNRARGNAAQLHEKYKALARDLQMQGDRVTAEYYLQFADHYFRVLSENRARFEEQRPRRDWQPNEAYDAGDGNDEGFEGEEGERESQLDQPRGQGEPRGEEPRYAGPSNGEARFDERDNRRGDRAPRDNGFDRGASRRDEHGREEPGERIEVDRLPPSIPFSAAPLDDEPREAGDATVGEAPRRRGRPRRPRPDDLPAADA